METTWHIIRSQYLLRLRPFAIIEQFEVCHLSIFVMFETVMEGDLNIDLNNTGFLL